MVPLRLNFSNVLLEETDFSDNMGQTIIDCNHNGSNLIEISNLDFYERLVKQYPNYSFVFSKQADLLTPFSPEVLNAIAEQNKFVLIGLPNAWNADLERLKELEKKNCFEITVNSWCPQHCNNFSKCILMEQNLQLEYSNKSIFEQCVKTNRNLLNGKNLITLEAIQSIYAPLGFHHFTFDSFMFNMNIEEVAQFYIQYFIKPEFYNEVYIELLREAV